MHSIKQLSNKEDLELLIHSFYHKAVVDPVIGHIFTDIARLDLEQHLPTIVSFWESSLFQIRGYQGNPMLKHLALNQKIALEKHHFERWLELWTSTVDENYTGVMAEEAKYKARMIAQLMMHKISIHQDSNLDKKSIL